MVFSAVAFVLSWSVFVFSDVAFAFSWSAFVFFSCSYRFFVVSFHINTIVFYKTQLNLSELISYFKFGVKFGAKFPQVQRGTWELSSELEVPRKFISSARDLSELVVTSNHFKLFQITSSLPLSTCKFTNTREHSNCWFPLVRRSPDGRPTLVHVRFTPANKWSKNLEFLAVFC